jgi:hypothetical protein
MDGEALAPKRCTTLLSGVVHIRPLQISVEWSVDPALNDIQRDRLVLANVSSGVNFT